MRAVTVVQVLQELFLCFIACFILFVIAPLTVYLGRRLRRRRHICDGDLRITLKAERTRPIRQGPARTRQGKASRSYSGSGRGMTSVTRTQVDLFDGVAAWRQPAVGGQRISWRTCPYPPACTSQHLKCSDRRRRRGQGGGARASPKIPENFFRAIFM